MWVESRQMYTSIRLPILLSAAVAAGGVIAQPAVAAPRGRALASVTQSRGLGPRGYFPQRENWSFRGLPRHRGHRYFRSYGYGFFPTAFAYPFFSPFGGYGYSAFNPYAI